MKNTRKNLVDSGLALTASALLLALNTNTVKADENTNAAVPAQTALQQNNQATATPVAESTSEAQAQPAAPESPKAAESEEGPAATESEPQAQSESEDSTDPADQVTITIQYIKQSM